MRPKTTKKNVDKNYFPIKNSILSQRTPAECNPDIFLWWNSGMFSFHRKVKRFIVWWKLIKSPQTKRYKWVNCFLLTPQKTFPLCLHLFSMISCSIFPLYKSRMCKYLPVKSIARTSSYADSVSIVFLIHVDSTEGETCLICFRIIMEISLLSPHENFRNHFRFFFLLFLKL